jgi:uncharacterized protein (TIGR00251 family)
VSGGAVREASRGEGSATVTVHVLPRASREGVAGLFGNAVRVRLTAPPLENRANEALVRFLSATLGVPRSLVTIVSGRRGRKKVVRVAGISRKELFLRLGLQQPPD